MIGSLLDIKEKFAKPTEKYLQGDKLKVYFKGLKTKLFYNDSSYIKGVISISK